MVPEFFGQTIAENLNLYSKILSISGDFPNSPSQTTVSPSLSISGSHSA
ncbi:hypothetical protein ACFP3I_03380 [Chryseobacterium arachidis]